jgi:glycosyltransferase involved in cell wall biosynthesis
MAATEVATAPFLRTSGSGSLANLLAYGRAVIASDIEPHREMLAEAPGVLALVPALNPKALAAEILALTGDDSRREGLSRAALAYAAQNSYAEMARKTVRVYDEVLR